MKRRSIKGTGAASVGLALLAFAVGCRGLLGIDEDRPLLDSDGNQTDPTGLPSAMGEASLPGDARLDAPTTPRADGAPMGDTDGAPTGDSGSSGETGTDSGTPVEYVAADYRFANWPLPPVKPLLSQYDLGTDTVTDKTTQLVWQRTDTSPKWTTYSLAKTYCENLTLAEKSDWRLPTRIELLSIFDYSQSSGFLSPSVFPNRPQAPDISNCWTSSLSLVKGHLDDHFAPDLAGGQISVVPGEGTEPGLLMRCVRGGPSVSPSPRYVLAGGTVKDVSTGLVWAQAPLSGTRLLTDATTGCANLDLGGHASGWRLPNVRELISLIDETQGAAPLVDPAFGAGSSLLFWSSTALASDGDESFGVDFGTANVHSADPAVDKLAARCVR